MPSGPAKPTKADDAFPVIAFSSPTLWHDWLQKHQAESKGLWVKFAKKDSGIRTMTYSEALEVALCHGWIDGLVKRLDEQYYLQRFTPRTARSKWSKINCAKATGLIERGKMMPAGLAAIESARRDGRWDAAYDSPRTATVPPDLAEALEKNAKARKFFDSLDSQNRYAVLHRIQDARRPEIRARRIAQFVTMLAEGRKFHP